MWILITAYALIALGTCIALYSGYDVVPCNEKNLRFAAAGKIIGAFIVGATWPVYWAAAITHKLKR